jgi:hypothetical protein
MLAGGTDFYPAQGSAADPRQHVLDINGLADLRGIADRRRTHVVIGARDDMDRYHPRRPAAGIRRPEAGRARGRIGADPEHRHHRRKSLQRLARRRWRAAADGARRRGGTALARLGTRLLPLDDFHPRQSQTALRPADELVTAVRVPRRPPRGTSHFRQARRAALSRHLHRHGRRAGGRRKPWPDRSEASRLPWAHVPRLRKAAACAGAAMLVGILSRGCGTIDRLALLDHFAEFCRPSTTCAPAPDTAVTRGARDRLRALQGMLPRRHGRSWSGRHEPASETDRAHGQRPRPCVVACLATWRLSAVLRDDA